jgi:hypothetical protein
MDGGKPSHAVPDPGGKKAEVDNGKDSPAREIVISRAGV